MDGPGLTLSRLEGLVSGRMVARLNRFCLEVRMEGRVQRCLLRNTGRLRELRAGTELLCIAKGRGRTSLVLIGANLEGPGGGGLTILDPRTQAVAFERAHELGAVPWLRRWGIARREVSLGVSRLDYEIRRDDGGATGYLELKSAAQLEGTAATYPDCPTDRGVRHIRLLGELARSGVRSVVCFVATSPPATSFSPNRAGDPRVEEALVEARANGVEVRCVKVLMDREGAVRVVSPDVFVKLGG